jgi:hypothetical protein
MTYEERKILERMCRMLDDDLRQSVEWRIGMVKDRGGSRDWPMILEMWEYVWKTNERLIEMSEQFEARISKLEKEKRAS